MFSRNSRTALALSRMNLISATVSRSPIVRTQAMSSSLPKYTLVSSVQTNEAYAPFAHYSQAIKAAGQVWLSGQIPADAQGNLIKGSMTEQTKAIIKNTEAILKASGTGLDRVVKVVVYIKDASVMPEFASVYDPAFPHRPARSMVEVSKLPAGVDIQVDFIAVI
ncbi:hypothetical protein MYU51_007191 [Penicillium brevicompactum]|uniref:uncharacterized protein n=1 Tax=Penicillium brevicompactum TaxID=5074 RepID=UPI0025425656|nr:uncharacterized protein N7506_002133 [Penicillium brevicompactum]KAJ5348880.1 hypothetical protein N7506_002133 [Penicillium brevicompactum]